jgi:PKD repeat protein
MIDASYSMASTNTPVNFTSSESKSSWKYHWDFGDGSSETTTGPSVTHSYSVSGAYLVKLTIQSRWDNAEAETSIDIN